MPDSQYAALPRPGAGLDHRYGPRVHLLSYPYPMSVLARACADGVGQPEVGRLVAILFDWLLGEVSSRLLLTEPVAVPTRMRQYTAAGMYEGEAVAARQQVVVVDIARAGILPAMRFYEGLHAMLDPRDVRQDHVTASRQTDGEGRVVGVRVESSKIGGPVDGATVLIPDPMGATSTSITEVIRRYKEEVGGTPRSVAAVHLIVTPEYIARLTRRFPDVHIFAIRLDRGLSSADVLRTVPGERWEQEVGLNDRQYIVPGAGGMGEVLNNSWV